VVEEEDALRKMVRVPKTSIIMMDYPVDEVGFDVVGNGE